jgi:DNA-directed RNA polymerase sigma subunit (sigma70/sigma32)
MTECIEGSTGYKGHNGRWYFRHPVSGERLVYRWVYKTMVGDLLPEEQVRHTCDNPGCVNPEHLVKGTHQDNMDDKVTRGRQHKGETHYLAKLTDVEVQEVKWRFEEGETLLSLAKEFGVSKSHISALVNNKQRNK